MLVSKSRGCYFASHFMLHSDPTTHRIEDLVRSLARQLCQTLPPGCGYRKAVQQALSAHCSSKQQPSLLQQPSVVELWTRLVVHPLWLAGPAIDRPVVLVLEALDECDSPPDVEALRLLLRSSPGGGGCAQLPLWVGVFITTRLEPATELSAPGRNVLSAALQWHGPPLVLEAQSGQCVRACGGGDSRAVLGVHASPSLLSCSAVAWPLGVMCGRGRRTLAAGRQRRVSLRLTAHLLPLRSSRRVFPCRVQRGGHQTAPRHSAAAAGLHCASGRGRSGGRAVEGERGGDALRALDPAAALGAASEGRGGRAQHRATGAVAARPAGLAARQHDAGVPPAALLPWRLALGLRHPLQLGAARGQRG